MAMTLAESAEVTQDPRLPGVVADEHGRALNWLHGEFRA